MTFGLQPVPSQAMVSARSASSPADVTDSTDTAPQKQFDLWHSIARHLHQTVTFRDTEPTMILLGRRIFSGCKGMLEKISAATMSYISESKRTISGTSLDTEKLSNSSLHHEMCASGLTSEPALVSSASPSVAGTLSQSSHFVCHAEEPLRELGQAICEHKSTNSEPSTSDGIIFTSASSESKSSATSITDKTIISRKSVSCANDKSDTFCASGGVRTQCSKNVPSTGTLSELRPQQQHSDVVRGSHNMFHQYKMARFDSRRSSLKERKVAKTVDVRTTTNKRHEIYDKQQSQDYRGARAMSRADKVAHHQTSKNVTSINHEVKAHGRSNEAQHQTQLSEQPRFEPQLSNENANIGARQASKCKVKRTPAEIQDWIDDVANRRPQLRQDGQETLKEVGEWPAASSVESQRQTVDGADPSAEPTHHFNHRRQSSTKVDAHSPELELASKSSRPSVVANQIEQNTITPKATGNESSTTELPGHPPAEIRGPASTESRHIPQKTAAVLPSLFSKGAVEQNHGELSAKSTFSGGSLPSEIVCPPQIGPQRESFTSNCPSSVTVSSNEKWKAENDLRKVLYKLRTWSLQDEKDEMATVTSRFCEMSVWDVANEADLMDIDWDLLASGDLGVSDHTADDHDAMVIDYEQSDSGQTEMDIDCNERDPSPIEMDIVHDEPDRGHDQMDVEYVETSNDADEMVIDPFLSVVDEKVGNDDKMDVDAPEEAAAPSSQTSKPAVQDNQCITLGSHKASTPSINTSTPIVAPVSISGCLNAATAPESGSSLHIPGPSNAAPARSTANSVIPPSVTNEFNTSGVPNAITAPSAANSATAPANTATGAANTATAPNTATGSIATGASTAPGSTSAATPPTTPNATGDDVDDESDISSISDLNAPSISEFNALPA